MPSQFRCRSRGKVSLQIHRLLGALRRSIFQKHSYVGVPVVVSILAMRQLEKRLIGRYVSLDEYVYECLSVYPCHYDLVYRSGRVGLRSTALVVRQDQNKKSKHTAVKTFSIEQESMVKKESYSLRSLALREIPIGLFGSPDGRRSYSGKKGLQTIPISCSSFGVKNRTLQHCGPRAAFLYRHTLHPYPRRVE